MKLEQFGIRKGDNPKYRWYGLYIIHTPDFCKMVCDDNNIINERDRGRITEQLNSLYYDPDSNKIVSFIFQQPTAAVVKMAMAAVNKILSK
jgi:hypothetical protein